MFKQIIIAIQDEMQRDQIGFTEMAYRLKINQPTLHRIISGSRGLGGRVLIKILAARPHWSNLINDNGNDPPTTPAGL